MTPPPVIWYTDHDGIAVPTDSPPPGAVPYMLARPMPIETAPRDGEAPFLGYSPDSGWNVYYSHITCRDLDVTLWLPLPPAPEET